MTKFNEKARAPYSRKWSNDGTSVPMTFWKGEFLDALTESQIDLNMLLFSLICRFLEVLQSAEDFLVDIPKLWEYLAEIVDPLFSDSVVPLTFLRPLSASVNTSLAANFVAAIIKELVKTQVIFLRFEFFMFALFVSTVLSTFKASGR